jgi:hypothetical protein
MGQPDPSSEKNQNLSTENYYHRVLSHSFLFSYCRHGECSRPTNLKVVYSRLRSKDLQTFVTPL